MARTAKRYEQRRAGQTSFLRKEYSVGIYSRLSVNYEDRKSESIENQIEIIRKYIEQKNSNPDSGQGLVVYDTYVDCGVSGTSFEREDFERLMNDVKNHAVDCIIVKDLSRFGRDYLETGNYIEKIFPFLGVRFIAVMDGFDSISENTLEQKLSMNIKNLVNDMYAKDISKRVSMVRKMSAQNGVYIGSTPPYGYRIEYISGIRKLVINPESADIIRYLFESYVQGMDYKEITASLYMRKVHRISDFNKYGHTFCQSGEILHQWKPEVIRVLLSNPVYTGKLVQCKTKTKLPEGQKGVSYTDKGKWITVENSHEAIVEQNLFKQAGNRLNGGKTSHSNLNLKDNRRKATDEENIFRNVLYCKKCGGKMHSNYYQSRVADKRLYGYFCSRAYYIDSRKCEKNYIREEVIKDFVAEQIRQILQEQRFSAKKLTAMNEVECDRIKESYRDEQRKLMQEAHRLMMQSSEMYMYYKEGIINAQEYYDFRENKMEYNKFCEKRIGEINRKIRKAEIEAEKQNKFLRSLWKVKSCKKMSIQLVETLIEKILVSQDEEITIFFRFCKGGAKEDER